MAPVPRQPSPVMPGRLRPGRGLPADRQYPQRALWATRMLFKKTSACDGMAARACSRSPRRPGA